MKKFFLITALLFGVTLQVKADTGVLLKYVSGGGFSMMGPTIVTIQSDGKVYVSEASLHAKPVVYQLAELSTSGLDHLSKKINLLHASSAVTDPNPRSPICEDAPTTTITAYLANGTSVEVFKDQNCHKYESDDPTTETLSTAMLGFIALLQ